MSQFEIGSGLQVPVSLVTNDGRKLEILRGGYLRQVVLIKEVESRQVGLLNFGPRQYVEAVLGWVDNRSDASIADQARALYAASQPPAGPRGWTRTWEKGGDPEVDDAGRCTLCGSDCSEYPYQQADHWLGEHYVDWSDFNQVQVNGSPIA